MNKKTLVLLISICFTSNIFTALPQMPEGEEYITRLPILQRRDPKYLKFSILYTKYIKDLNRIPQENQRNIWLPWYKKLKKYDNYTFFARRLGIEPLNYNNPEWEKLSLKKELQQYENYKRISFIKGKTLLPYTDPRWKDEFEKIKTKADI